MLCPRFFTRQGISKVEQENVYQKTLIISIRKRVLQKSQIKVSKSRHIWESSANRLWGTKIRFIPCKRRGKSSVTSHLLRFFNSLLYRCWRMYRQVTWLWRQCPLWQYCGILHMHVQTNIFRNWEVLYKLPWVLRLSYLQWWYKLINEPFCPSSVTLG